MPTYDYKCTKCELVFEEFHSMNEKPKIKCPSCHSSAKKTISLNQGIIFKGSGFYITDYAKKNSTNHPAKKDTTSGNKAESKTPEKTTPKEAKS